MNYYQKIFAGIPQLKFDIKCSLFLEADVRLCKKNTENQQQKQNFPFKFHLIEWRKRCQQLSIPNTQKNSNYRKK